MPISQVLAALTAAALAAALAASPASQRAPSGFNVTAITNRMLTPNGDGRNDAVVVQFENPQFSEVTGRVYDVHGGLVAAMQAGPVANTSLQWDGRSDGRSVGSGIYIYVIEAEGRLYKGAVFVIK